MKGHSFSKTFVRFASKRAKYVPSSGTYPKGFKVGAVHCGVKKSATALDLTLITSKLPCSSAAVFTTNVFKAAPVQVSQRVLKHSDGSNIHSIIVNSGCANAVTGERGIEDAMAMVKRTDEATGYSNPSHVSSLVMSTGVIGQHLPLEKILDAVPRLFKKVGDQHEDWLDAAEGICTTDTFPKFMSTEFNMGDHTYRIAGMAKGAGMIHPNMATLLGFFVTDAPVSPDALNHLLKYAADRSFNSISVDGDMSTNDTIAAMANGAGGGDEITTKHPEYEKLRDIITDFAIKLAQLVVRDGEGATKFVTICVNGASTFEDAKKVAFSIATSSLVKTALFGQDANWGRILCATGYSGASIDPAKTSVSFLPTDGSPELKLLVAGEPQEVDEERASQILGLEDLDIIVSLGDGNGSAKVWTCDLSHEYVTINGDYRS